MKYLNLKNTALAALAVLTFAAPSAHATITYSSGDIWLGFRQDGNDTSDFVVKLSAGATLRDAGSPVILTLSGVNAQLTAIFGSGWATDAAVFFGAFGTTQNVPTTDPSNTLYVSEPTGSDAPIRAFNQNGPANSIIGLKTYYVGRASTVTNGALGNPSDLGSYTVKISDAFSSTNLGIVEGNVSGGLELYRLPDGVNNTPGTLEGTVTYTGGDTFTFTPVPEPATAALGGFALLGLAFRRVRKTVRA